MEQALELIDKGLHPLKVASGFERAADMAVKHLETLTESDF